MTDLPSWAVRGAKCVFVGGEFTSETCKFGDPGGLLRFPVRGPVYTIREVRIRLVPEFGNEVVVGILLDEVRNPVADGGSAAGGEMAFDIREFRPLASLAGDIGAHFEHLLDVAATRQRVNT